MARHDAGGLYYLRARYYDPAIGRFLGQDPVPAGNPYAYVGNNPVNLVDRSGLCHQELGHDQVCRLVHQLEGEDEDKEGSSFNVECSGNRYVVINGVCVYPSCPSGVNTLLCGNGESGFGVFEKAAAWIWNSFRDDENDFLLNCESGSDCGLQFGPWCAQDTLGSLLRLAQDNPECAGAVIALASLTTVAILAPPTAPGAVGPGSILLEAAITSCMTES